MTAANGDAALLALTNQGTIEDCSVSGTVTAQNGKAAGLVLSNAGSAVIRRCRVDGTVTASGNAAGGVLQNNGRIERCAVSSTVASQDGVASGMSVKQLRFRNRYRPYPYRLLWRRDRHCPKLLYYRRGIFDERQFCYGLRSRNDQQR